MAQTLEIFIKCPMCGGDAEIRSGIGNAVASACTFPGCLGPPGPDGYISAGSITFDPGLDDVMDKCNDVMGKCNDIKEKCDEIKSVVDAL